MLKDPYTFDFLNLGVEAQERDLEQALLHHLRAFLLELGSGFAFAGSQYHLVVGVSTHRYGKQRLRVETVLVPTR